MRCCRSPMPSTCLYSAGALTPSRSARAARLTDPMPASSASSAPEATTAKVLRPALGMGVLGEERQDGVGDLLRVLRVGVVARIFDHLVPAQSSWEQADDRGGPGVREVRIIAAHYHQRRAPDVGQLLS